MAGLSTGNMTILLQLVAYNTSDLSTTEDTLSATRGVAFADGTGVDQANTLFSDTRALVEGANEELDLHDGSLYNNFGVALALSKVKGIYVRNNSTAQVLTIGAAATTPIAGIFANTNDAITLAACTSTNKAQFLYISPNSTGLDVSTNSHLKFAMGGTGTGSHTYDVIVVGI